MTINYKRVDGVLGIRTRGGWMVGEDESTVLWRHHSISIIISGIIILELVLLYQSKVFKFSGGHGVGVGVGVCVVEELDEAADVAYRVANRHHLKEI